MSRYPNTVEYCWAIVETFIEEWQKKPYYWDTERDVQIEIMSRLKKVFAAKGLSTVLAYYKDDVVAGFERRQVWSMLSAEPTVYYEYEGEECFCYPDIVLWENHDDPENPPDASDRQWPILWACEIKYGKSKPSDWDVNKLNSLIEQGISKYGCWIDMKRERASSGNGIDWDRDNLRGHVWICEARLPAVIAQGSS